MLITEIRLGLLLLRALFGVALILFALSILLALLGVPALSKLYNIPESFRDPAPLLTWLRLKAAYLDEWARSRPFLWVAGAPVLLFFAWVGTNDD